MTPFLVDAYNLLFWCLDGENLEHERSLLIQEVNFHAKRRGLEIILVFDATWTNDPLAKMHYDALEIIFTDKGVTADDQIVEMVQEDHDVIVVTSDRALAKRASADGAKTATTPAFFNWLRKQKSQKAAPVKKLSTTLDAPKVVVREGSLLWYERIFEEKRLKNEERRPKEK